ncbi:MAG: MFS transporter [Hyphomonadaceae bacterium]
MSESKPLSSTRIAAYTLPAFPLSALSLPLGVYIPPLYAEHTTLALGLVGTLLFTSRIIDVFTDPTFGLLADRMRPRLGRRRFWMLIAIPILSLATWKLFHPPSDAGAIYLIGWLSLVYLGYTMAFLSHLAWGAELSGLYDDRSRVLGWREVTVTAGMLTVLILPTLVESTAGAEAALARAHIMALFIVILLPICIGLTCILVPDPLPPEDAMDADRSLMADLKAIAKNAHMPKLLSADLATATGIGITSSLYVWISVHVLNLASATSLILVGYFAAAVVSVPIWMFVALRAEKHTTYAISMLYGVLTLSLYFLIPGQGLFWAVAISALYGCAYGAGFFLARSIVADIADADELETGQKRMGVFFSGLTLTSKIGFAFGLLLSYNILDLVGFDPNGTVTQSQADWLLRVFVTLPISLFCLAGVLIRRHTLTRAEHANIRQQLDAKSETASPDL